MLHWRCRTDLESVMISIFNDILCMKDSGVGSSSHQDIVNIFLNAANFSMHNEGCSEETMSFEDFRTWCTHVPSVRKLLGSLLMPPDSGILHLISNVFVTNLYYYVACFDYSLHTPNSRCSKWVLLICGFPFIWVFSKSHGTKVSPLF